LSDIDTAILKETGLIRSLWRCCVGCGYAN